MKKIIYYLSALWIAAAFAYALYENFTEAGLYAKLLSWQLETFGSASVKVTTVIASLIYGAPGIIGLSMTRSARTPPDPIAAQRNTGILLLAFGLIIILAGIGGYFISVTYASRQNTSSESASAPKLVSVDLDNAIEIPSTDGAEGASVTGWLRRDETYLLEEKGYGNKKTVFCPIVGARWKPSEPVKVFLRADPATPIALYRPPVSNLPDGRKFPKGFVQIDFNTQTPLQSTIEGTLHPGKLPDYVSSFFNKEGIKVADDHVVLEAKPFYDGPRQSEWEKFAMTSHLLTYIAVPLGLVICLMSLIPFARWRKLQSQLTDAR